MVACSKAFLKTETWELDEILSLENVFIQITKKVVVIFQETAASSLQSSCNGESNLSSSLLSSPSW